jgi:phenylpyruvate tautomerase PptA (4-oxalocrotonate tautomerase family)
VVLPLIARDVTRRILVTNHVHHPVAADWFGKETDDIVFCRVTQMELLRLLSNPAIMGVDAIDRSQAWRTYDQLWADGVIALRAGRSDEQKKTLYARIAELAGKHANTEPRNVFVAIHENQFADWSFGNGVGQYLERDR